MQSVFIIPNAVIMDCFALSCSHYFNLMEMNIQLFFIYFTLGGFFLLYGVLSGFFCLCLLKEALVFAPSI